MSSGVQTHENEQLRSSGASLASTGASMLRFPDRSYDQDWTRTSDAFTMLDTLGEGTFGSVIKAQDRETGEIVALKKIKMETETEGFPITAIREIKILKTLKDCQKTKNVVKLKEVISAPETVNAEDKGSIYLVFEYLDHDLSGLMDLRYDQIFNHNAIKCFMKQLMTGLHDLHSNKIIHRDIKASNLLVTASGELKIADFGLARPQSAETHPRYTANVITLWYRPPELLLVSKDARVHYTSKVDIWSSGCILAEMIFRKAIFKGKTELEMLDNIFQVLGTPTRETAPELFQIDAWKNFKPANQYPSKLQAMCQEAKVPDKTFQFLSRLLCYDPSKRCSAFDALDDDWFWIEPTPCQPSDLATHCPPSHEITARKEKEKLRLQNMPQQPKHPYGHPGYPSNSYHNPYGSAKKPSAYSSHHGASQSSHPYGHQPRSQHPSHHSGGYSQPSHNPYGHYPPSQHHPYGSSAATSHGYGSSQPQHGQHPRHSHYPPASVSNPSMPSRSQVQYYSTPAGDGVSNGSGQSRASSGHRAPSQQPPPPKNPLPPPPPTQGSSIRPHPPLPQQHPHEGSNYKPSAENPHKRVKTDEAPSSSIPAADQSSSIHQ